MSFFNSPEEKALASLKATYDKDLIDTADMKEAKGYIMKAAGKRMMAVPTPEKAPAVAANSPAAIALAPAAANSVLAPLASPPPAPAVVTAKKLKKERPKVTATPYDQLPAPLGAQFMPLEGSLVLVTDIKHDKDTDEVSATLEGGTEKHFGDLTRLSDDAARILKSQNFEHSCGWINHQITTLQPEVLNIGIVWIGRCCEPRIGKTSVSDALGGLESVPRSEPFPSLLALGFRVAVLFAAHSADEDFDITAHDLGYKAQDGDGEVKVAATKKKRRAQWEGICLPLRQTIDDCMEYEGLKCQEKKLAVFPPPSEESIDAIIESAWGKIEKTVSMSEEEWKCDRCRSYIKNRWTHAVTLKQKFLGL